ncbi:MAG: hypothetical protein D6736_14310 [Nitrospinota bacterium]|nr:MAG: hypothetical protein D6736_14310 [Nitrospinota bacterium]
MNGCHVRKGVRDYFPLLLLFFFVSSLSLIGCEVKKEETQKQTERRQEKVIKTQEIVVAKASTAPTLDGKGTDEAWKAAQEYIIAVKGYSGDRIKMKAVYTDTDIFFLFTWSDYSHSIRQAGSWERVHVGGEFGKAPTEAQEKWEPFGFEDMLSLVWNIDSPDFEQEDLPQKVHLKGFKTSQGKMDRWLWAAGTTDPVHKLLDQYIDTQGVHDDSGKSFLIPNTTDEDNPKTRIDERKYPRFMPRVDLVQQKIPKLFIVKGQKPILLYYRSEVEPFDLAFVDREATLPAYIFEENPSGSIIDINVGSTHLEQEETWTVEVQRKLTTATPEEDIQFDDRSKTFAFTIGVFDNTDTDGSFSEVQKLTFAQ